MSVGVPGVPGAGIAGVPVVIVTGMPWLAVAGMYGGTAPAGRTVIDWTGIGGTDAFWIGIAAPGVNPAGSTGPAFAGAPSIPGPVGIAEFITGWTNSPDVAIPLDAGLPGDGRPTFVPAKAVGPDSIR